ncbi:hypothetical protein EV194_104138 [Natronoflexus pectinivorans]|uniref:Uncharacterized protein n=1 Tax=Natronoflexus pectinivorans TaxID=682526 RepID=A0A4R2GJT0_9BACT|nr:hypothetical protein EV194_104138 [Natronoflexus pectinivorans]
MGSIEKRIIDFIRRIIKKPLFSGTDISNSNSSEPKHQRDATHMSSELTIA